jgi:hypothetical protein
MPQNKCMSLPRHWQHQAAGQCMLHWGDADNNASHSLTSGAGFVTFLLNPSCHTAARYGDHKFLLPQKWLCQRSHSYSAWSNAEKVHVSCLRTMAGVGDCCVEVLIRDFNHKPIMHHWVLLAGIFMRLKCTSDDRLAHCAWVADDIRT